VSGFFRRRPGRDAKRPERTCPLLIDGCHRLYKAARLGREQLPSLVLTAAETLAIRHDAVLGPPRTPARGTKGEPAMITITIWHNVAHDAEGRHTAMLDGYQPGDPMVAVFTYQGNPAGRTAEQIADEAFDTFNDHPRDLNGADLACTYYGRTLLSFPGK